MYYRLVEGDWVFSESLAVEEKRELVARVAESLAFQKSPRLRAFLLYVADCTLENRPEDAREQQIAQHVFHRKPGYNPGQDNIVRVEARSLRKRLEAYFEAEGKDEPVVVTMPKGSYALTFEPRCTETAEQAEVVLPAAAPEFPAPPVPVQTAHRSWRAHIWPVLVGILACLVVVQWFAGGAKAPQPATSPRTLPFSALMREPLETYVVTSDSSLVLIQELIRRQLSLDEYISRRYPESGGPDATGLDLLRLLRSRQYTNAAEVNLAGKILQLNADPSHRVSLRYSRDMEVSDFKNRNIILLGSPIGNPWTQLLGASLNFQFEMDERQRGKIRNRFPRQGEQTVYSMTTPAGETGRSYGVIAFVPNVTGTGSALLIAGTSGEGTQAAGEFICDEARTVKTLKAVGIDPTGPPRYFEILIQVDAVAGNPSRSTVLAERLVPDSR
jgi:hypothetical protein